MHWANEKHNIENLWVSSVEYFEPMTYLISEVTARLENVSPAVGCRTQLQPTWSWQRWVVSKW